MFSGKFPLELTVAEAPQRRQLVFSLEKSPFMDSFQGSWQVCCCYSNTTIDHSI